MEITPNEELERLKRMAAEGLVRLGSGKLPDGFWEAPRPDDPSAAVRKSLVEERESSW
jgi:hypothetical protein